MHGQIRLVHKLLSANFTLELGLARVLAVRHPVPIPLRLRLELFLTTSAGELRPLDRLVRHTLTLQGFAVSFLDVLDVGQSAQVERVTIRAGVRVFGVTFFGMYEEARPVPELLVADLALGLLRRMP